MKLLVLDGSPRKEGHTVSWIRSVIDESYSVKYLPVRELDIHHCIGCQKCFTKGKCVFDDDFKLFEDALAECDTLIVSSPLYFNGLPSVFKTLIDRCEVFYARKVILKESISSKKGLIVMTSGMNRKKDFDGALSTLKLFFLSLNIKTYETILLPGTDNLDWKRTAIDAQSFSTIVDSLQNN